MNYKMLSGVIGFCLFIFLSTFVNANTYLWENSTWQSDLIAVHSSTLVWGDVDNDGDWDLALMGFFAGANTKVYINNGTSLVENSTWESNLTEVYYGSFSWGDIDNDGDLDLAMTGCSSGAGILSLCDAGHFHSFIYINNGTSLVENSTWKGDMIESWKGWIAFGDVDNDGKSDLALNGISESGKVSKIYINNGTSLVENSTWEADLTALFESSLAWGDVDNDGDLDLITVGDAGVSDEKAEVYINNGTSLVENSTWQANLLATEHSSVAFGDVDNDGDLDLTLTGHTTVDNHRIYENDGTTFVENQTQLPPSEDLLGVYEGSQSFGDYDNDGDLDLIVVGREGHTILYLYDGSFFTDRLNDPESGISEVDNGPYVSWIDVDNDNDLDLIITGYDGSNENLIKVYTNNITTPNTAPSPPTTGFDSTYANNQLTLTWGNGSDTETPTAGLYYNLRIGTTSGGNDIVSGVYGGGDDNGYFGNMMQRKSITLDLPDQTYYWSVQTIDTALANGTWSTEQTYAQGSDSIEPTITIHALAADFNTSNTSVTFNATVYDDIAVKNVTLYGNWSTTGWHENSTNSSGFNNTPYEFDNVLLEGAYKWKIRACDSSGNCESTRNRTFVIDTTKPLIALISPSNESSWSSSSTVDFSYNVSDIAVENCSLIINDSIEQTNSTITIAGTLNFSISLDNAAYNWTINCTDYAGLTNSSAMYELTVGYTAPTTTTSPDGGGGDGGSGSGGVLPEATDKLTKTYSSITPVAPKTISSTELAASKTDLTEIKIDVKERVTGVTITVEKVATRPTELPTPTATAYQYIKITKENLDDDNLEQATMKFKVSNSWLSDNSIDADTVALNRYTDEWAELPTVKLSSDANYTYYQAETSGFSYFVITGELAQVATATTTATTTTSMPETTASTILPPILPPSVSGIPTERIIAALIIVILILIIAFVKFRQ